MDDDYKLSDSEHLAPLVQSYLDVFGLDFLEEHDLKVLDFALEWTQETVTYELTRKFDQRFQDQYAVQYGFIPNVRFMEMPNLDVAKKVALALNGSVVYRRVGGWVQVTA